MIQTITVKVKLDVFDIMIITPHFNVMRRYLRKKHGLGEEVRIVMSGNEAKAMATELHLTVREISKMKYMDIHLRKNMGIATFERHLKMVC